MKRRLLKTAAFLGLFTVTEKGLAAARQVVLAAFFGAGAAMDALVLGLSVADLMVALLTGSFLGVFMPLYSRWRARDGSAVADARGLNVIFAVLGVVTLAALALALRGGALAGWIGYGFGPQQREIVDALMPWLAVFMWGTAAAVLVTGLFHVRGRFVVPQVGQLVERVAVLALVVLLASRLGIEAAAVALAVGSLALVGTLVVAGAARRPSLAALPRPSPGRPEIRAYLVLFLPLMGAAVVDQAVLFTDRAMASALPAGGVSALYFATVVWRIPVMLLCTNFCTVLFPTLADDVTSGDPVRLHATLSFGLKSMILVLAGATALLMVLGRDVTALLFERGAYGPESTGLTARCLLALSVCLVVKGLASVMNMTLFALRRTGTVAVVGVGRVGLNVVLNLLLIGPLGAVGIALSTSLTLFAWLAIMAVPFRRALRACGVAPLVDAAFRGLLLKVGVAAAVAGLVAAAVSSAPWLAGGDALWRGLRVGLAGSAGTAAYGGLLALLRLPEAAQAARLVTARLGWRPS